MNIAPASLVFVALSSSALAQAAVGLAYEAPDGCPSEREFVDAVVTRGADFEGAATNGVHRVMVVALRKQGDGFAGVFQMRDGEAATNKREVQGASCSEVVDALAVVTAIALRPEIATPAAPPASAAPPAVPLPVEAPATPPGEVPLRGTTFVRRRGHESVSVPAGTVSFDLARTLTLYGGAMIGGAPSTVIPRLDLDLTVASFVTTPERAQRIMGVVLQSRLSLLGPGTYRSSNTTTNLIGYAVMFGFCVTPHYDSAGLVLLVCADAGLGDMSIRTTEGGALIQSKFISFGVASLQLDALYNLTSVVNLGLKVGGDAYPGTAPWSAERADGTQIFAQNGYSAYLLLGLGFRF